MYALHRGHLSGFLRQGYSYTQDLFGHFFSILHLKLNHLKHYANTFSFSQKVGGGTLGPGILVVDNAESWVLKS